MGEEGGFCNALPRLTPSDGRQGEKGAGEEARNGGEELVRASPPHLPCRSPPRLVDGGERLASRAGCLALSCRAVGLVTHARCSACGGRRDGSGDG